jgi:hypothetical protein
MKGNLRPLGPLLSGAHTFQRRHRSEPCATGQSCLHGELRIGRNGGYCVILDRLYVALNSASTSSEIVQIEAEQKHPGRVRVTYYFLIV